MHFYFIHFVYHSVFYATRLSCLHWRWLTRNKFSLAIVLSPYIPFNEKLVIHQNEIPKLKIYSFLFTSLDPLFMTLSYIIFITRRNQIFKNIFSNLSARETDVQDFVACVIGENFPAKFYHIRRVRFFKWSKNESFVSFRWNKIVCSLFSWRNVPSIILPVTQSGIFIIGNFRLVGTRFFRK